MTLTSPPDWQLLRLGQLFRERKEKGSDKDFPPLSVTMRGIVPQLETAAKTDDGDNRKVVRVGDYVINSRSDRKGSGGISDHEGSVSLISIVLQPRSIDPRFAHHLLRSPAFQEEFYRWGHGIVADLWTTRYADMKNIRLRVPDLSTQREIADFLDRETARIDLLIEKKQKLVVLLGEKWIATLTSSVTGGQTSRTTELNPVLTLQERVHGKPKPIGWKTDKLHRVFRVRRSIKNTGMKEDNLLSLSYGRIIQKDIQTSDGLLPENFEGYQIVEPGNIVLRLTDLQNDKRSLRQGLVTQRGIITSAYDAVEVQRDNDARFWFYSLLALDLAKHYYSLGGGVRQSVKFADFPNDWIYCPDLSTQREIADLLDREAAKRDTLKDKTSASIDRLKEYRSALITAAVTGQIDVTTYAKSDATDRRLDAIQEEMGA